MAARAIIRIGDKTSHGGTVLEGFAHLNIYGKIAAGVGHKVMCPQCKRQTVILEGAASSTFMGVNVAVEGMKTSCGAVLIASQSQATIEIATSSSTTQSKQTIQTIDDNHNYEADQHLVLLDQDGSPLTEVPYSIKNPYGIVKSGKTGADGKTQIIGGNQSDTLDFNIAKKS